MVMIFNGISSVPWCVSRPSNSRPIRNRVANHVCFLHRRATPTGNVSFGIAINFPALPPIRREPFFNFLRAQTIAPRHIEQHAPQWGIAYALPSDPLSEGTLLTKGGLALAALP